MGGGDTMKSETLSDATINCDVTIWAIVLYNELPLSTREAIYRQEF